VAGIAVATVLAVLVARQYRMGKKRWGSDNRRNRSNRRCTRLLDLMLMKKKRKL